MTTPAGAARDGWRGRWATVIVPLLIAEAIIVLTAPPSLQLPAAQIIEVSALFAAVAVGLGMESLRGDAVPDALGIRLPVSRRAWLVALLPAVSILFVQLLNPGGLVWVRPLPAIAVAITAEIAFRGYAFLQLRRAGARFLVAALIPGTIALMPYIIQLRSGLAVLVIAGLLAQSVWLAWLVERWKSVWIAIASMLLLTAGLRGIHGLTADMWVWLTLLLRLWIIGMSVAMTQMLQRRKPMSSVG
jgi:hypothetical protein